MVHQLATELDGNGARLDADQPLDVEAGAETIARITHRHAQTQRAAERDRGGRTVGAARVGLRLSGTCREPEREREESGDGTCHGETSLVGRESGGALTGRVHRCTHPQMDAGAAFRSRTTGERARVLTAS